MKRQAICASLVTLMTAMSAAATEYRAEVIEAPAPADEISAEIVETLSPNGIRVVRGESRAVWEFWPCKSWEVQANFTPSFEVLYPFEPGALIGVLRLPRRGHDFRDQPISRGVYTLRYALQPVDGNHVGTSPTRDFFLMVRTDADTSADKIDADVLNTLSAEAAESTHPAMLSLQPPPENGAADLPSMRHDQERDWWILRFAGKAVGQKGPDDVVVEVVVVGHAVE